MIERSIPQNSDPIGAHAPLRTIPSKRILVVDDDAAIRQLSARVLSHFGYLTETVEDGAAAWEALQIKIYDLLITDHNVPKITGIELVKKVRSARMFLPVILASGALLTQELKQNEWLRPVATLAKPFTTRQLLETVNQVLAQPTISTSHGEMPPDNR